ncbi:MULTISPECIES: DUF6036 family nucleotidyltransferase [unclassified Microbacterium]|uniref:DUF6036 family nucleotidyltransferase n=2 Tax=Microbacterium TaxID=33882 RepID=UPI001650812B|nr:DUF6036 family nucleotidyltransferase [Microbacterium sp. 4-7]
MGDSLDRDDIISGLRDLVGELHTAGEVAGIRLVGGAALVIRYFDRRTTGDLDSLHIHPGSDDAVLAAAERVADRRGWSAGWFNFAVENADSVPTFGRRPVEWETIYDRDSVVVQVASKEALLAMKLRANRPGRDVDDIRQLLALCSLTTLADVEEHYEDFYPGDGLTDRAIGMVERILDGGLPTVVPSPGPIDL